MLYKPFLNCGPQIILVGIWTSRSVKFMVRVILSNNYDKVHGIMLSLFPSDHVNCKGGQLKFQLDLGCSLAEVSCPVLFLLSDITYFYSNRSSAHLDFSNLLVKKKKINSSTIQVDF